MRRNLNPDTSSPRSRVRGWGMGRWKFASRQPHRHASYTVRGDVPSIWWRMVSVCIRRTLRIAVAVAPHAARENTTQRRRRRRRGGGIAEERVEDGRRVRLLAFGLRGAGTGRAAGGGGDLPWRVVMVSDMIIAAFCTKLSGDKLLLASNKKSYLAGRCILHTTHAQNYHRPGFKNHFPPNFF
jgi:hypothetical protein